MEDPEGGYKKFKLGVLFDIASPKRKFDANKISFGGKHPYVARTSENNGIRGFITEDERFLNNGNTISFGQDTATIFYQCQPYFTGDMIKILTYKDSTLNETISIYLIATMRKAFSNFSWGNTSFNVDVLNNVEVQLPVKRDKTIDYKYIEENVNKLKEEHLQELEAYLQETGFDDCTLSTEEIEALLAIERGEKQMRKFAIVKEFKVSNSHNILKSDVVFDSGTTPYVTASEGNNSIVSYISYEPEMIEQGNSIMIGGKTLVITYQPCDFFSNDSHNLVLTINDERGRNESAQLYMVAALYKTLGPKYSWGDSISKAKIQKDVVFLPITDDGNSIDYVFMETYINAIKKQCIANLKETIGQENEVVKRPRFFLDYHEGFIPLYSLRAACGYFDNPETPEPEGWVDATGNGFSPDPQRHFAVHAKGDSMEPKIKDGDICVFEWYQERGGSRNGEIVLTRCNDFDPDYDGKFTIKRYYSEKTGDENGDWEHTKIQLQSLNPSYAPIDLNPDEADQYRTIGILKAVL